ncbi:ABC transporter permease [Arthrobacter sp. StoSoilB5]|uniref:ABC transporter permease n=1 Tax=Arthrobacter sp. StoSoilB5 TaxID=2830992 RepID=UPI001CC571C2|nr:ABC transporter permease [Arthrobacter sp. StoSoilB5]BCW45302.1 ABC transporter permease [Arthrobacter sp. StoSoilB5]
MTTILEPVDQSSKNSIKRIVSTFSWRQNLIYVGFAVIFVLFSITLNDRGFLTSDNLLNIVRQTSTISVMAVGVVFVIAAAQIDLSVGATAGLASVTTAMTINSVGLVPGIVAGLATGVIVGLLNGFFVSVVGVPSFLATLGMLGMAQGAAMWITGAAPQAINDLDFTFLFGDSNIGPIPGLLLWTLLIVLIGHFGLRRTGFGRQVLATGGNSKAAAFSGVHTKRVVFLVLLLSSVLAALAGMLYAGRFHTGSYNTGTGDELSVIAAVILGGTSLFGGRASVVGALLGSLMIGLLNNGLILMGLDSAQQQVARGAIIILAVAVTARRRV